MPLTLNHFLDSEDLPTLPRVAVKVIELTQQPEPDMFEIARVVRTDSAIASRILQAANSVLFGLRTKVSSVEAAIPHLGFSTLKSLILGFSLINKGPRAVEVQQAMSVHWRSSLTQAVLAERLALEASHPDPSTSFLAALLQDVGVLSALSVDSENYLKRVWGSCTFPSIVEAEMDYYGFSHVDISNELCLRWGLPDSFCDAVATHHDRLNATVGPCLHNALKAASLCVNFVERSPDKESMRSLVEFLQLNYEWSLPEIETVLCDAMIEVHEVASVFSCDIGTETVEQMQADAQMRLRKVAASTDATSRFAAK